MNKKKNQNHEVDDSNSHAEISNLIDAARMSLDLFDSQVKPTEEEEARSVSAENLIAESVVNSTVELAVDSTVNSTEYSIMNSTVNSAMNSTVETNSNSAELTTVFDMDEVNEVKVSLSPFDDDVMSKALKESNLSEDTNDLYSGYSREFNSEDLTSEELNLNESKSEAANELQIDSVSNLDDDFFVEDTNSIESSNSVSELVSGSELENFESVNIEELEFIEETQLESIVESVLFATDKPVSLAALKLIFKGTNVTNARLKKCLESLQVEYAGGRRGITLEEVGSGYQLRTKIDNMEFLRRSFKAKAFKLSGPALEVLAIVAYKQPLVKAEIDEIRGVESGHLLRALMEKNLVLFAGKSDLPGKPMQYGTTRKFLEIFGLRNLKELPTLSQIDELIPEGIGDEEQKPKLADITESLSEKVGQSYSEGEEELNKITDQLEKIDTSSEFFEKEKLRQKQEKDAEKAKNLREALAVGEEVNTRDRNWLKRYDELLEKENEVLSSDKNNMSDSIQISQDDESQELEQALLAWDSEELKGNDSEYDLFNRIEDNDLADIDEEIV